jgi:hypothetical protein
MRFVTVHDEKLITQGPHALPISQGNRTILMACRVPSIFGLRGLPEVYGTGGPCSPKVSDRTEWKRISTPERGYYKQYIEKASPEPLFVFALAPEKLKDQL